MCRLLLWATRILLLFRCHNNVYFRAPKNPYMQRKDFYLLGIVWLIAIVIFYPIASADYLYADEAFQLWFYKPGSTEAIFTRQGRFLTEYLVRWLFYRVDTTHQLIYLRLFSLAGWMICLPVWYIIIKRIVHKEPAYRYLPFFTCLYLVTSLPFSVSVHWSACLQLFIPNTCGLLSGYVLYNGIHFINNRFRLSFTAVAASVVLGTMALFTYQSGFCCFVIPFLLHFIMPGTTKKGQVLATGVGFLMLISVVYFLLFKLSMQITQVSGFNRTDLHIDLLDKIPYFFTHPFERSFWLNIIVYEYDAIARALYKVLFIGWIVLAFVRFMRNARTDNALSNNKRFSVQQWLEPVKYIGGVMLLFALSYFPSLIIQENFASNRSQLALDLCVWLVMSEMFLYFMKRPERREDPERSERSRRIEGTLRRPAAVVGWGIAFMLVVSSWYNLRYQFLRPAVKEYAALKDYLKQHYHPGIKALYVIKAPVDAFVQKFHVYQNMDEFGVPSTTFDWGAEFVPRELVYEQTGSRQTAEQLVVKLWPDIETWTHSGDKLPQDALLIDVPAIINSLR